MTNSASDRQSDNNFSPKALHLIRSGYVSAYQIKQAQRESLRSGRPLTQLLELLTARPIPAVEIDQYQQQQLVEPKGTQDLELLSPEQVQEIDIHRVKELIDRLIPIDICRREGLIPLDQKDYPPSVSVAMVDPDNEEALGDLHRILHPRGLRLQKLLITPEDYQQLIDQYSEPEVSSPQSDKETQDNPKAPDLSQIQSISPADDPEYPELELKPSDRSPVIKAVHRILTKSLKEKASEIYIIPNSDCLRIRFRKQGAIGDAFPALPKQIIPYIINQFKIIANINISEQSRPQTGRIRRSFRGQKFDFRVNTMPSDYGEKMQLRISECTTCYLSLDRAILDPDTCHQVRSLTSHTTGLILVTGATGSCKSTFIYTLLREKQHERLKISTIEKQIECLLPGVKQVEVPPGMNFARAWQQVVRQGPNIIFVEEIPDKETAQAAIEASLNSLVLICLSAADTISAITQLKQMGIAQEMLDKSLVGGIHHCLLRQVCPQCRIPYTPSRQQLKLFGLSDNDDLTFYRAKSLPKKEIAPARDKGELCPVCQGVGLTNFVGVYQVLAGTKGIKALISQGAAASEIYQVASAAGMKTLLDYSIFLVRKGQTTLEELKRVLGNDAVLAGLRMIKLRQRQQSSERIEGDILEQVEQVGQGEKAALEEQVGKLKREKAALDVQVGTLQQEKAAIDAQVGKLKQEKAYLQKQASQLQREKAEFSEQVWKLQEEKAALDAQINLVKHEKTELETQLIADQSLSGYLTTENYSHLGEWEKKELLKQFKHQAKQREERAQVEIVLKILAELELFEFAKLQIHPQTKAETAIQKSYQLIYHRLLGVLQEVGVSEIETTGTKFDPHIHEVVMTEPTDEYPQGTVIGEIKPGYKMGDHVLRLAQVKVAD